MDYIPRFTKGRKRPGPCGTVMVGRFATAVFITAVVTLVWMVGIIYHITLMDDLDRACHGPVCQAADGARHQEFFAGFKNPAANIFVTDSPQRDGQKLVWPQRIIGRCLQSRLVGGRMPAIGEMTQAVLPEQIPNG